MSDNASICNSFADEVEEMRESKRRTRELELKYTLEQIALKKEENELLRQRIEGARDKEKWDALASKKEYEIKDLQYRVEMIDRLQELLEKKYTYDNIAELIPSMVDFFPNSEKEKYKKEN